MRTILTTLAMPILTSTALQAGRAVTEEERSKLVEALQAQGCTGGKMEFDNGKFEIDEAECPDSKRYDFDFDTSFRLISKKLED
ncbi:PepSY domain-containing protein [Nitrobacter sp.]|uniref:PepSY domain-containing protein n=1 Tax=unclassified Nitrobacter TaxID=2620411 RepID=UPI00321FA2B0